MPFQNLAGVFLDLAERDSFETARALEAEAVSADTGKQIEDGNFAHAIALLRLMFRVLRMRALKRGQPGL